MRHLFRIAALAASLLFLAACEEDETPAREIEVTPAYLNGTWILAEWNGVPLADGLYLYVTFNRRESTYEMYYNFDSMYARLVTGSYSIEKQKDLGYVVSGDYDYGNGDWDPPIRRHRAHRRVDDVDGRGRCRRRTPLRPLREGSRRNRGGGLRKRVGIGRHAVRRRTLTHLSRAVYRRYSPGGCGGGRHVSRTTCQPITVRMQRRPEIMKKQTTHSLLFTKIFYGYEKIFTFDGIAGPRSGQRLQR